ncbi:MAG: hypothetical protein ACW99U_12490 [Candidatus Thorarchaeota archaeon]|jgi:hypothetical protein
MKHVEYRIKSNTELEKLLNHLKETTSSVLGVKLIDIYFPKGKREFILHLECKSEKSYLEWRDICPPPNGANDWYEVMLTKNEQFR